ncbi:MAG: hypothetical protein KGI61_03790, partial [Patescibacteria group bacterium]|nr:hypothetical protein [Patescibacteria group bacterium]
NSSPGNNTASTSTIDVQITQQKQVVGQTQQNLNNLQNELNQALSSNSNTATTTANASSSASAGSSSNISANTNTIPAVNSTLAPPKQSNSPTKPELIEGTNGF